MPKITRYVYLLAVPFIIASCSTFDPPVLIPVYGHIDSIHFAIPPDSVNKQGSASAKIPYAWVYLDDNPVGAFQMPCTFPIVASNGNHNIKIYPGIIPVGGTSPGAINPFYQFYSVNINMQQGTTYKFKPTSSYFPWAVFPLVENFDEPFSRPPHLTNATSVPYSDTTMVITRNKSIVFGGSGGSGIAIVNSAHPFYAGMTNPADSLPTNGATPVMLEFNYRCSAPIEVGVYDTNYITPVIIYPAPAWNKMYVVLQTTLQSFILQPYRIYFYLPLDTPDGHTQDTLMLDNVKLLY